MSRPTPPTEIGPTIVGSLDDLVKLLARRRYELRLSQSDLEAATGLADGHVAKIEAGYRNLGALSLPLILQGLGVELEIHLKVRDGRVADPLHPPRPPGQRRSSCLR